MRALIIGITGFVGSHLAEYLLSKGVEVGGYYEPLDDLDTIIKIKDKISLIGSCVRDAIRSEPDFIFIMEPQKVAPGSNPYYVYGFDVNITGTLYIFDYIRYLNHNPIIILAGSSEEYGSPPLIEVREMSGFMGGPERVKVNHTPKKVLKLPITEDFSLNPISIHGASKAAQDMLGYAYYKELGMKIIRTRAFDITGEGDQSSTASDIARQIVEIEKGNIKELKVSSREIYKDFVDVRDVVKAYWLAATRGKPGEAYNVCSGKARSVQSVIDALRMQSTAQFEIIEDKTLLKVSDVPAIQGDHSKLSKLTDWKPEVGFAQTMGDLLDYWRNN
ncbi:MAG: GDP-mannose 4,6-dehydratase [Desulfocapsaceae bacterium]|nr:GDP-mannose 4,6-dehydratase [Desulfocapsaceae bacterium]